jgi:hypothetical protein
MGRVEFGCHIENDAGNARLFIAIALPDGERVEFVSDRLCKTQDDAKELITAVYLILTGEQKNVQYSAEGNLNETPVY